MYTSGKELLTLCQKENKRIWEIALTSESLLTGIDEQTILEHFASRYNIMKNSAKKALHKSNPQKGSLIDGVSRCQFDYSKGNTLCGSFMNYIMALAYSSSELNASMGKICACPTAGSCGILPAVLVGLSEDKAIPHKKIIEALITASAVGAIFTKNATVAGADGGCQAECGVAASMAAAAATFMMDGEDEVCLNAAGFAMINIMGLICDPVAGLVQIPCAGRNASGAINALLSADMALAGQVAHIPFDQVVESMYKVGKMLPPQLRETGKGGIAATPAAKEISLQFR